jgi:serine/threonine protein kinase
VHIKPEWTFAEAVMEISESHRPGSYMGGVARNQLVDAWGQVVGRTRALAEFDQALRSYGSMSAMSRELRARPDTLKAWRAHFAALPDDASPGVLHRGSVLGGWTLRASLGRGGNCEVWEAVHPSKGVGAIKTPLLHRLGKEGIARFNSEIEALKMLSGVPGVLPLLDDHSPKDPTRADRPFLVVPVAIPISDELAEAPLAEVVEATAGIAEALASMHACGISHRDVKPDNLYWLGDAPCIGDLGLVSYPGKKAITAAGRKLGPTFFIAPEMLNAPHSAKGPPADVYSLAKTLWVLATGMNFPVPGTLRGDDPVTNLRTYVTDALAVPLQRILEECTSNTAGSRPSAELLAERLRSLLAE